MNAIAPVGLEQDGARHQPVLQQNAGVEPKIGADIDEDVWLDRRAPLMKFFSSGYSAILAEISSPPTLAERTRNSAPK